MSCDAVIMKTSADPMEGSGAGMGPQNCIKLRLGDQAFIILHLAVTGHMDCPQAGGVALGKADLFSSTRCPEIDSVESHQRWEECGPLSRRAGRWR